MTIEQGARIPDVQLQSIIDGAVASVSTADLFAGRTVVIFGVPGAFTGTCSDTHLPGFLIRSDELRGAGVDEIVCTAVNDAAVMKAWAAATGAEGRLVMLADGNGEFARQIGLELDATPWGMGVRSRRYASIVEDGVVRYLGAESGPEVGVSSAEAVLAALNAR